MYFKTFDKTECSGCTACMAVCPKRCISMKVDEEGFAYPQISKDACISCGLCEKICPFENPKYENTCVLVYAGYLKDERLRMLSSSGGLFYALARWVIDQGGIVYGAAFDEKFKLRHIGVETLDGLDSLRGSKYLQSDIGNVFWEIRQHLRNGRLVYFVGVGCQVAGLKAFIGKDYNNLLTSDLVCHGVPSQLMFDNHIDYLRQKEQGEITSYAFRDNEGWGGCEIYEYSSQKRGKGRRKLYSYELSPYLYSFMYAFDFRYSCYNCRFARLPRQGDITLADYWGVKDCFPDLDMTKGVSLVLVNSTKGRDVWDKIKDALVYRLSHVKDAARENGNLIHSTPMPEIRKKCYEMVHERGYKSVAEREFRSPLYFKVKIRMALSHTKLWALLRKIKNRIRK